MLTNSHLNYQAGFTLLELIVASGIFAMTMLLAFATLSSTQRIQAQTGVQRTLGQTGRFAMETMARELRFANGFFVVDSSGSLEQTRPAFQIVDATGQSVILDPLTQRYRGERIEIASMDLETQQKRRIVLRLATESTGHRYLELVRCVDPMACLQVERAPLTDRKVEVVELEFLGITTGQESGPGVPFVQIRLKLTSDGGGELNEVLSETLSTLVTSRQYRS